MNGFRSTALCLFSVFLAGGCARSEIPTREITASRYAVVRVIDGDTFAVRYDGELTRVRIWGIDAPERGRPGAEEATETLRTMIDGQDVRLLFPSVRKRDSFGRLLCRVFTADGRDIGKELLDRGLVKKYRVR